MCGCTPKCKSCRSRAVVRNLRSEPLSVRRQGYDFDILVEFTCPVCGRQWRCITGSAEESDQVFEALSGSRVRSRA